MVWAQRHLGKDASALKIAIGHDSPRFRGPHQRRLAAGICAVRRTGFGLRAGWLHALHVLGNPGFAPATARCRLPPATTPITATALKFFTPQGGLDAPDITEILALAQEGARPEREAAGTVCACGYMKGLRRPAAAHHPRGGAGPGLRPSPGGAAHCGGRRQRRRRLLRLGRAGAPGGGHLRQPVFRARRHVPQPHPQPGE